MAKKIILIVLGAVMLLGGLGGIVLGIAVAAVVGSDNTLESGEHLIGTPTTALVSETTRISHTTDVSGAGFGQPRIVVSARSDQPVFLGIGRSQDVLRYLGDAAYDQVVEFDLSPYRVQTVRHEQTGFGPAGAPTQESFWSAAATGPNPTLDWPVSDGDYRLVLMNLTGEPGVATEARFGVKVDGLFGIGVVLIVVGVLGAIAGAALLIWGLSTRVPPRPAYPGGAPAGPPGAGPPMPPGSGPPMPPAGPTTMPPPGSGPPP